MTSWPTGPECGHSACRQCYIDTGGTECVLPRVSHFDFEAHGVDSPSYFPGIGTGPDSWADDVYVGSGRSTQEAADDALESLAQAVQPQLHEEDWDAIAEEAAREFDYDETEVADWEAETFREAVREHNARCRTGEELPTPWCDDVGPHYQLTGEARERLERFEESFTDSIDEWPQQYVALYVRWSRDDDAGEETEGGDDV